MKTENYPIVYKIHIVILNLLYAYNKLFQITTSIKFNQNNFTRSVYILSHPKHKMHLKWYNPFLIVQRPMSMTWIFGQQKMEASLISINQQLSLAVITFSIFLNKEKKWRRLLLIGSIIKEIMGIMRLRIYYWSLQVMWCLIYLYLSGILIMPSLMNWKRNQRWTKVYWSVAGMIMKIILYLIII